MFVAMATRVCPSHCHNLQKICNAIKTTVTKYPTTPQPRRYTTLRNVYDRELAIVKSISVCNHISFQPCLPWVDSGLFIRCCVPLLQQLVVHFHRRRRYCQQQQPDHVAIVGADLITAAQYYAPCGGGAAARGASYQISPATLR